MKQLYFLLFFIFFTFTCSKKDKNHYITNTTYYINYTSTTIKPGDTLETILKKYTSNNEEIKKILDVVQKNFNLKNLIADKYYEIHYTTFNSIEKFFYWKTPVEFFSVVKSTQGSFDYKNTKLSYKENIVIKEGEIIESLWEAMSNQNINPETILNFADIFSWQVDFLTEVRNGDKFKILYKQYIYENGYIEDKEILAAEYSGETTKKHIALYFESKDKKIKGYFTPDGKSLRKIFLRAPLNYRRVSSHFSKKRFHPILRIWRKHHGTDFVAPFGTPVVSIGDGTVVYAGWKGGYGKTVIIKHNSTYSSLYGHLLKIPKNIKVGKKVLQGELIGYLGSTGLSTGPHLHFEMRLNNNPINFFNLKLPEVENIPESYLEEFKNIRKELSDYLQTKK